MQRYSWAIIAVAALVVVGAVAVAGFAFGDNLSVTRITVMRATPHQLAEAMKTDNFYADYRQSALLVSGPVASVGVRGAHLIIGLQTDSSYAVLCDLGTATTAPRVGEILTVLTAGHAAERLPAAVLLNDCVVP